MCIHIKLFIAGVKAKSSPNKYISLFKKFYCDTAAPAAKIILSHYNFSGGSL